MHLCKELRTVKETRQSKLLTHKQVPYVIFKEWEDDEKLIHGFSTKHGGVSEGEFTSLNLGFNRGDEDGRVEENYRRLAEVMEIPFESLVLSKQIHETKIEKVTYEEKGNGIIYPNKWESADGIYTTELDIALVTHYADCVPLFFYSKAHQIIGLAHAGWRGTVGEIGPKMIEIWTDQEKIDRDTIEVAIGPSIGPCCFEVHEDVAEAFMQKFLEHIDIVEKLESGKYKINLWEYNRQLLIEAGVQPEKIYMSQICTCCGHETFYSHRYTQGKRGTLGAIMYLRK